MCRPRISFREKKLSLSPDPIIVMLGEKIEIELFADLTHLGYSISDFLIFKYLTWKLHFKNGNPFEYSDQLRKTFEFKTSANNGVPMHSDIVDLGVAQIGGAYKFDISLEKSSSAEKYLHNSMEDYLIEEVDPIIIVIN